MKTKIVIIIGLVLLLGSSLYAQSIRTNMAPDFTLPDINGKIITLSKSFGQGPIYISFWATWCKPCLEELKIVEKLFEKYKDKGFRVFAINTEGPRAVAKIKSFVTSYGLTFDFLMDSDGEVFRRRYKGSNLPLTVMADPEGKVIFSSVGFRPGDEVKVEKLIIENLPGPEEGNEKSGSGQ
jgi:peroxiredoxin